MILPPFPWENKDFTLGFLRVIISSDSVILSPGKNNLHKRKKAHACRQNKAVDGFTGVSILSDTMTSSGRKIDVKTVERYLEALMESFVIYQAKRYNIRGKQYLKTLEKYYVVDIGIRNMLLGTSGTDVGHILENIVYLELRRRGFEVYIGKIDELEVDFVARGPKGIQYIQVAASVRDETTLAKELASLQRISDNYPKVILTLDEDHEADYEGIRRINALEWLVGKTALDA